YRKTDLTQGEKDLLAQFDKVYPIYRQERDTVLELKSKGDDADAMLVFRNALQQKLDSVQLVLAQLADSNARIAKDANQRGLSTAEQTRIVLLAIMAIACLLGASIALVASRTMSRGIGVVAKAAEALAEINLPKLVRIVEAMAAGDLSRSLQVESAQVKVKSRDEVGDMASSFNKMGEQLSAVFSAINDMSASLRTIIGKIREASQSVATSSAQLSQAADQAGEVTQQVAGTIQQVAQGTQEQSASITETSSSMEQLSEAIGQIAKGAQAQASAMEQSSRMINQMSQSIKRVASGSEAMAAGMLETQQAAQNGVQAVNRSSQGMESIRDRVQLSARKVRELGEHSGQIGAIVETIDDIAEQTNLLALNAAIEAARAGEHGKGFAVVADEVRKLAERSSKATKEIAQLIATVQKGTEAAIEAMEKGSKEVEEGNKLASEAGRALEDILRNITASSMRIQEIAASAMQMENANAEVVKATDDVSSITEENTAATEEMAAGAQQVVEAVESIAAISETNAAASQEVSAATQEMTAQVEEMTASAQALAEMANSLEELVARFKIDEESPADDLATFLATSSDLAPLKANGHGETLELVPVNRKRH
ncbi:MAG: methyl-accepting chemotaxis protein, partial [Dehalococcoidia bacterium]|nr:methyl-accepting chemotaxis protein [Dehalococcoidia bacterium]